MASMLEQLLAQLNAYQPYQGLSPEEIQRQANQRYQSEYDQKRLSARQAHETSDAALVRELAALQASYDQQRQQSRQQTENTYRQADRQSASRGMQRSSYNNATLANIDLAGAQAINALNASQRSEEGDIGQQRAQLSQQLAQQLAQYDASQTSDAQAYADELEAREYERRRNSQNDYQKLAMQLYEYQHELEQEAQAQANWLAQFNAKYGNTSASSARGGARKKKKPETGKKPTGGVSGVRPTKDMMY